jgi:hypothetical protein
MESTDLAKLSGAGQPTRPGLLAIVLALPIIVLPAILAMSSPRVTGSSAAASVQIVMPDTDLTVDGLVQSVRDAARGLPGTRPDRDLRVIFTDELPAEHDRPFLGGLQVGSTVWVRVGVASPTRTLMHEVTHVLTPGAGHDEPFRSVYLASLAAVYDEETVSREARRLAWVYDGCYLDDSCPELVRSR